MTLNPNPSNLDFELVMNDKILYLGPKRNKAGARKDCMSKLIARSPSNSSKESVPSCHVVHPITKSFSTRSLPSDMVTVADSFAKNPPTSPCRYLLKIFWKDFVKNISQFVIYTTAT